MNYHLMIDDKFIDGFINDCERKAPGKNTYIIEGSATTAKLAKHPLITFAPHLETYLSGLHEKVVKEDKVFIHWLHDKITSFILNIPKDVGVGMFFWGGDIFPETDEEYINYIFEPLSLEYFKAYSPNRPVYLKAGSPMNIIRNINRKRLHQKKSRLNLQDKSRVLSRLNYFLHWSELDYDWVKKRIPELNAEFHYHFYGIGLDSHMPSMRKTSGETIVFWLGNSSTVSNNHLDALKLLGRFKDEDIKIYCPLSYGESIDSHYTKTILSRGEEIFGNKFHGLTGFLPRDEYYKLFDEVDVAIMFHNRTQAAGNVFAFMQMGKPVFMKQKSTLYELLQKKGTIISNTQSLRDIPLNNLKNLLTDEQIIYNREILNKEILNPDWKNKTLSSLLN